jgi:two-component system sensor histidine kinase KdpD
MDGTLSADDTPGGGLTMTLSLPAAPADPEFVPGHRELGDGERGDGEEPGYGECGADRALDPSARGIER